MMNLKFRKVKEVGFNIFGFMKTKLYQPLTPQLKYFSHFLKQNNVLDVPTSLTGHNFLGKHL